MRLGDKVSVDSGIHRGEYTVAALPKFKVVPIEAMPHEVQVFFDDRDALLFRSPVALLSFIRDLGVAFDKAWPEYRI